MFTTTTVRHDVKVIIVQKGRGFNSQPFHFHNDYQQLVTHKLCSLVLAKGQ